MKLPKSAGLVSKYKQIYYIATGQSWNGCLCGSGFQRLYSTCLNFSKDSKKLDEIYKTN